jgi:murein biosynthesis integral membrane protein MurJ
LSPASVKYLSRYFFRGGVLLACSALGSKLLSFWRDRLLVSEFSTQEIDLIFAAFRLPDFFFFLFVGATLSVVFVPRFLSLSSTDRDRYMASFFWGVSLFFGGFCLLGIFMAPLLLDFVFGGFANELQQQMVPLVRGLFVSIFFLSLSGVFGAYLQAHQRFWALALGPLFYMGAIVVGLLFFVPDFGRLVIPIFAVLGSLIHLFATLLHFVFLGGRLSWSWKKPVNAWRNFATDFWRRVFNNAAFQINQTVDLWIASFLVTGSVMAFSIGTALGQALLSVVGFSVANAAFPKLAKNRPHSSAQNKILFRAIGWIFFFTIPFAVLSFFFSAIILQKLFGLEGTVLEMTNTVFFWTAISLPFGALIPLISRYFLANDDTLTPLKINFFGLSVATGLAIFLSLFFLPPQRAILGLALGNFVANILGALLFLWAWYRDSQARKKQKPPPNT